MGNRVSFLLLVFSLSLNAYAETNRTYRLIGTVKSFDDKTVSLLRGKKTYRYPRSIFNSLEPLTEKKHVDFYTPVAGPKGDGKSPVPKNEISVDSKKSGKVTLPSKTKIR